VEIHNEQSSKSERNSIRFNNRRAIIITSASRTNPNKKSCFL